MNKLKRFAFLFLTICLCAALLAGCGKKDPVEPDPNADDPANEPAAPKVLDQIEAPKDGDTIVIIETSEGTIKAVLFPEYAPKAVENFIGLANSEKYKDLVFHRVVKDFVVQTGDPTGTGKGGESYSGTPVEDEFSNDLHHYCGALGMANAGANLNTSQFYIVQGAAVSDDLAAQMGTAGWDQEVIDAYKQLGGQPTLDYRYTVFGQVYEGMDVVNKIANVNVDDDAKPKKEVKLINVTVETYSSAAAAE